MIALAPRIHPTALVEDGARIGAGTAVWDTVHIRSGAVIGEQCIVGEKTYVAGDVTIGDRVKINAFVYLCAGVTLEDGVMVSAGTVFTNDRFPRATLVDLRELRPSEVDEHTRQTRVCAGATIGAHCTIGNDLSIGRFAMIGMGSLVTRSVGDFVLAVGRPARPIGYVCRCGEPLCRFDEDDFACRGRITCRSCGLPYQVTHNELIELQPPFMMAVGARAEARVNRGERVGIVGGGILGMALAAGHARAGADVTLIEAAPALGGLAAPWSVGDFVWDRHYHVTLLSDGHLRALLRDLDLEDELTWSTPATGFYTDGRMHSMNGIVEFLKFPPLGLIDKLRLGGTILYASRIRDGLPLERVPVAEWLTRLSGRRTAEKIWIPLLRAKLGERYTEASASFIWAIIVRLYAARRSGLGRERFGYVPGGYARILERFSERLNALGVKTMLDAPVSRVARDGAGVGVTLFDGRELTFDRVAVTLPAPRAAQVCDGLQPDELDRLRSKRYQGIVCASLVLDEPLGPYYITNITETWVPFSAVIDMSAVVDRSQFGGKALVYLPKYVAPNDPLFVQTDDEIRASFVGALTKMYPGFSPQSVRAFQVSRVREVFPIPTLRYSDGVPPIVTSVPGLVLANSSHIVNGTLNVNETLQLAERTLTAMGIHATR